jgi:hypothetical protein
MAHGTDQAIFGLGPDNEATDITGGADLATQAELDAALAAHAATVAAAGTHGRVKQVLVDGQDEVGDDTIAVTGLAAADVLISVLVLTTKASIATAAFRPLADFTVGAGALTVAANPVDNTNNQYLITYIDAA